MKQKMESYKDRSQYQLDQWVKGNPIHNKADDECCPDFSCCNIEFLQPLEIRETFRAVCIKADEEGYNEECHPYDDAKMGMLMSFLGHATATWKPEKKIHITGESSVQLN